MFLQDQILGTKIVFDKSLSSSTSQIKEQKYSTAHLPPEVGPLQCYNPTVYVYHENLTRSHIWKIMLKLVTDYNVTTGGLYRIYIIHQPKEKLLRWRLVIDWEDNITIATFI